MRRHPAGRWVRCLKLKRVWAGELEREQSRVQDGIPPQECGREGARGFQGGRECSARCENQERLGLGALEMEEE